MLSIEQIEASIGQWLEDVVIAHNLCPFARQPWQKERVDIQIVDALDVEAVCDCFVQAVWQLEQWDIDTTETSLLVLPEGFGDFHDYLDLVSVLNELIDLNDWRGRYQIATFHPDYVFADTAENARQNYTNRAPYPIIHVLREESLDKAIASMPDSDQIPQRNIEHLENMPEAEFSCVLKASQPKNKQ